MYQIFSKQIAFPCAIEKLMELECPSRNIQVAPWLMSRVIALQHHGRPKIIVCLTTYVYYMCTLIIRLRFNCKGTSIVLAVWRLFKGSKGRDLDDFLVKMTLYLFFKHLLSSFALERTQLNKIMKDIKVHSTV